MTPDTFLERVTGNAETPLSRLGSSKALYADTRGDMESDTVHAAARRDHHHAKAVFEEWAAADATADHWQQAVETQTEILQNIDAPDDAGDPPAIVEAMRSESTEVGRLGATVGWSRAIAKKTEQVTGFFVGQADPQTADSFRSVATAVESQGDSAADRLATVAASEDDWTAASSAATAAIDAAYDEYVQTLESMGVNPKPVC